MSMGTIVTVLSGIRSIRSRANIALLALALSGVMPSRSAHADAVTDWNAIAMDATASTIAGPRTRVLAMTHAAIHDAINSIDPRYTMYAQKSRFSPASSPEAAVASAAHDVLSATLPASQTVAVEAAYANALAAIQDGPAKSNGIAAGRSAAAMIVQLRSTDGSTSADIPYTLLSAPGVWEPTPPAFLPAFLPGWGNVRPFVLATGAQFRPDAPALLDLTSAEYASDYNEVKNIGSGNSMKTTRTDDQSAAAKFWYEGSPPAWNRIARAVSAQARLDLWQNARLFALLNLAQADSIVSDFNAKYHFNFWRPVNAIRKGDTDDNPATTADSEWLPFLVTPNFPDYPSNHSVLGGASAEVLARVLGTDFIGFTTTSGAPFPGITRSFASFSQASQENANSRVYAGIHFRTSCVDGMRMGEKIGKFVFMHVLNPLN